MKSLSLKFQITLLLLIMFGGAGLIIFVPIWIGGLELYNKMSPFPLFIASGWMIAVYFKLKTAEMEEKKEENG